MTIHKRHRLRRPQSGTGFTLVEVLFGLGMVSVILAGVLTLFQSALLSYRLSNETTRATLAAQEKMEQLASTAYASLNAGTTTEYLPKKLKRTTAIAISTPTVNSKTVTVTVRRGDASSQSDRVVELVSVRNK